MSRRNRFLPGGRAIFFGVALICMVAIGFLAVEIVRDLRLLNSANSDNVQWTLSQAEVEFLEMRHALDTARRQPEPDLDRLIEEFDIFYSRISTLETGALYESLRDLPEFAEPMQRIRRTLDDLVPLIDGPRADLAAGLPRIESAFGQSRADLRELATSGLYHFARQSDFQRISVAVTLMRLGLLTSVLVMVLIFLLRHAQNASRQTERRGHELAAAYTRLNTILDTSLDAVLVADLSGDIQQFNPAAERIFKYDAQQVVGRNIGGLIVPDHLRDAHEAGMARMRAGGERRGGGWSGAGAFGWTRCAAPERCSRRNWRWRPPRPAAKRSSSGSCATSRTASHPRTSWSRHGTRRWPGKRPRRTFWR